MLNISLVTPITALTITSYMAQLIGKRKKQEKSKNPSFTLIIIEFLFGLIMI